MKIISYNINGIRAALNKGLAEWLAAENADIVCLQEVKALPEQVALDVFKNMGYHISWHAAEKKGYSGIAILSKIMPEQVQKGYQESQPDTEGRVLLHQYAEFVLVNTYFPSGSSGDERQEYKYNFLDDYFLFMERLQKKHKNIIICGDVNICHKPIDIHNPQKQTKSSGFLAEERAWFDKVMQAGWQDAFRCFSTDPHQYTWWSYRAGARKKNLGWRIDYFLATTQMRPNLKNCSIHSTIIHSDHCPISLEIF
jgi:exodeoxyribonuclease-3